MTRLKFVRFSHRREEVFDRALGKKLRFKYRPSRSPFKERSATTKGLAAAIQNGELLLWGSKRERERFLYLFV